MKTLVCAAALLAFAAPAAAQVVRFEDATDRLPAFDGHWTMDVGSADLDGDGDLDLVLPQEFRLNRVLRNEGGRFVDDSARLERLSAEEMAGGPPQLQFPGAGHDSEDVSIADFDRDGRLDLIIVQEDDVKFGRTGVQEFYRGREGGRFSRARLSLLSLRGGAIREEDSPPLPDMETNAVAHADVDGDGDLDLILAGAGQDRLLIADGNGGFIDRTDTHVPREDRTTQDAEFVDVDADGDLDVVLGQEGGWGLWLNDGTGRFADGSDRLPDPGNVEARKVRAADVDGDGDVDLFFAHVAWQGRAGQDRLVLNDGAGRFAFSDTIPAEQGTTVDGAFVDLDGDGDLDLIRADLGPVTVWENDGRGGFTDATARHFAQPVAGPNVALEAADFDGDGVVDLYVGRLKAAGGGMPDVVDRLFLGRVD
jgi:hypothetical protein